MSKRKIKDKVHIKLAIPRRGRIQNRSKQLEIMLNNLENGKGLKIMPEFLRWCTYINMNMLKKYFTLEYNSVDDSYTIRRKGKNRNG